MASVPVVEDSFLSQVENVRKKIRTRFARAHQVLQERETTLLSELQQLEEIYKGEERADQTEKLTQSKETEMPSKERETSKRRVAQSDSRVREVRERFKEDRASMGIVVLEWDFEGRIGEVGSIRVCPVPDYKKKGELVLAAGRHAIKKWSAPGVFYYPQSICIDSQTKNVFVCDGGNDRVQVFTQSYQLLFEFNEEMDKPYGICTGQQKVYITQRSGHSLKVYTAEGKLLQSVGKEGKNELEFVSPTGVAVSTENGRIYVCECDNRRVQCLDINLEFSSYISDVSPRDIKLTAEEIVLLEPDDQLIRYYNYSHQFTRKLLLLEGQKASPRYFCLDLQNNILLSDYSDSCVYVLSPNGELIHKFGKRTEGRGPGELLRPTGIVIDSENRIVVVSHNYGHCIQLF